MRPAGSRCRIPAVVAVVLAVAVGVSAAAIVATAGPAPAALAAAAPLTVGVDRHLSLIGEAVTVTISGQVSESLEGTKLVVRVEGPADLSQIEQSAPELREANKIVKVLGAAASTTSLTTGGAAAGVTPTTTEPTVISADTDLAAGKLVATVVVPPDMPAGPGAYLLVVEVKLGDAVVASGQAWVGKAASRDVPLDLAFVWPVSAGIHRASDEVFYDQVLEQMIASTGSESGDLRAMLSLPERFPDWSFTLAVEPVLLTQLRDMANGFVRADEAGNRVNVAAEDASALNAGGVLTAFKALAAQESVEIAVGPYAGADLGVLAREGWRDGFEQIQMGKQELVQTLGLPKPPSGARSPDLALTSDSLAYYAEASIDHVVVDGGVAGFLTEEVDENTVAVRARDEDNDRVTLVFADSALSAQAAAPWDAGAFFAVLAAELAAGSRDAIVVAPQIEFTIPPAAFVESVGRTLEGLEWVETQTLTELLRSHSPGTRPVMLKTGSGGAQGYVEESLLASLRTAHAAVTDLSAIADATHAPVDAAHRLLFIAESRWWSRAGTSPRDATIGLQYSVRAGALAQGELDKVGLVGADSTVIIGREGVVSLTVENKAEYPVTVDLRLSGSGFTLPDGGEVEVELSPGRTQVPVRVVAADGPHNLVAQLVAGAGTIDELDHSLRFITVATVLPGIVAGAVVIAVGVFFLARWYLRRRRPARAA